jgi:hypothetical protein
MTQRWFSTFLGLSGLFALALAAFPSHAQSPVQSKAPMYSYVADWQLPRSHWNDVPAAEAATRSVLDKSVADGTLIGYGYDEEVVHTPDGETHDQWWSAMSLAGLLRAREAIFAAGVPTSPALDAATKHWDMVYVSHYYNWHPGAYKNAYTWAATYQLSSDAPANAVDMLSQNIVAPVMESLLADGTIIEYEIDELAVHSQEPGTFTIVYLCPSADGIDKVQAAIRDHVKAHALVTPAFGGLTKNSGHRDELLSSHGTYK